MWSVLYVVAVECMSSAGMLECKLCCELLLLLNMAHMGCLVCGVSSTEWLVDV